MIRKHKKNKCGHPREQVHFVPEDPPSGVHEHAYCDLCGEVVPVEFAYEIDWEAIYERAGEKGLERK